MTKRDINHHAVIFLFLGVVIKGFENTTDGNLRLYVSSLFNFSVNTGLTSNLTSNLAFRHCNQYCNRTSQETIANTCLSVTPRCRGCYCDTSCHKYGDCCPHVDGKVGDAKENMYQCVGIKGNEYDTFGYIMATACPNEPSLNLSELSVEDIHPVTSHTSNITYINSRVADCNNDVEYRLWKKDVCDHVDSDYEASAPAPCDVNISPEPDVHVHRCDPLFFSSKFIDSCNVTGLWNGITLDSGIDLKIECGRFPLYPVSEDQHVFKNIYCFLCNGLTPSVSYCSKIEIPESINVLVSLTGEEKPVCYSTEWYDKLKNVCRYVQCRSGFELKGGNCVMMDVNLTDITFYFRGDFWPLNPDQQSPSSWRQLKSLVVQKIPVIMTTLNASNYVFSVYDLLRFDNENESTSTLLFGLDLVFRTYSKCCRLDYETLITEAFKAQWTFNDSGSTYDYRIMRPDDSNFFENESEKYKVVFPNVVPVKAEPHIYLSQILEEAEFYVSVPFTLPDCSFVSLETDDFNWNNDSTVTLEYADIVISPDNYTVDYDEQLIICKSTLEHLYSKYQSPVDPLVRAKNIVSLVCSILSLVCLILTFVTYCTFTSLLTLPTKNTMCLVVSLFIAQMLLQFADVAKQNDVACKIIGVLIHYFWLCVIFWMNVCSFHMFHVFVIDAGKAITQHGHMKRLLRYALFANGTPAIIVVLTIAASLGVSSGSQIGYGDGPCYLSTALLTGVSFVLPLCIVLILNVIFFGMSVRTMAKIGKMSDAVGKQRNFVHIYIKLSTLTGVFWIFSLLAENLRIEFLIFFSIILNASQGVFIFISYVANRRVLRMWSGRFGVQVSTQTSTQTASTHLDETRR